MLFKNYFIKENSLLLTRFTVSGKVLSGSYLANARKCLIIK
jgi:hypothetical protein